jgi:hypothetical protein
MTMHLRSREQKKSCTSLSNGHQRCCGVPYYTGAGRFTRVDLLGATESDEGTVALEDD